MYHVILNFCDVKKLFWAQFCRPSWLVDGNRFATKIITSSAACDPETIEWKSNPTKTCPKCHHILDNTDVNQAWPGLPRGVKFDPSDQEIIWHLLAKSGVNGFQPHPFINEFIPTVEEDDGICYTHPQKLPGVQQDGHVSHFFHKAIKAYNTGTRKRRKIHGDNFGDFRWHKTGRTKPVVLDSVQCGCKKIMVLYVTPIKGGKAEKTNWVMHQYHLGTGEDEKEGEYVISKVFYQQQTQSKVDGKDEYITIEEVNVIGQKADPLTPKSVTPDPPRAERRVVDTGVEHNLDEVSKDLVKDEMEPIYEAELQTSCGVLDDHATEKDPVSEKFGVNNDSQGGEEANLWDNESPYLLDSQQLVEGLSLYDEFFQSQSSQRDVENQESNGKPRLADYVQLGPESLKKDLEACQDLVLDPANLELDTPPDFRLSQIIVLKDEMEPIYEAELQTSCGVLDDHATEKDPVSEKFGVNNDSQGGEEANLWDNESPYLLDSQQLVEGLSLYDEFFQSQSSQRDVENQESNGKPRLADYVQLGPESLKKDLEACQDLVLDPANLELDTPPDFRLSQIEFESQESFLAFGGGK
ncbi:SUPPRESSOR OF GAMMA RESPONSE 1-like [Bidens hawaiensis]|uniref:SUPPRESSOR OF GAMMA RESPONSE 1-like n=1 Tax=Bidens hawaiensis TaxID=980011 RepID=UPI00404B32CD